MRLLDWIRGPEQTEKAARSKDDLERVAALMEQISDAAARIDPEKLRRSNGK